MAAKVDRSAWIPAPPVGSDPAIVQAQTVWDRFIRRGGVCGVLKVCGICRYPERIRLFSPGVTAKLNPYVHMRPPEYLHPHGSRLPGCSWLRPCSLLGLVLLYAGSVQVRVAGLDDLALRSRDGGDTTGCPDRGGLPLSGILNHCSSVSWWLRSSRSWPSFGGVPDSLYRPGPQRPDGWDRILNDGRTRICSP